MKRSGAGLRSRGLRAAHLRSSASARATSDVDTLVNNFLGAVAVDPVRGSRLYNVSVQSADPGVRRESRRRPRRRVREAELRAAHRGDGEEPAVPRGRDQEAADEGRRQRARDGAVSRDQQRAVARRPAEHRRREPQRGERPVHAGAHRADPEGSDLHPGQVAAVRGAGRIDSGGHQQPGRAEPASAARRSAAQHACS